MKWTLATLHVRLRECFRWKMLRSDLFLGQSGVSHGTSKGRNLRKTHKEILVPCDYLLIVQVGSILFRSGCVISHKQFRFYHICLKTKKWKHLIIFHSETVRKQILTNIFYNGNVSYSLFDEKLLVMKNNILLGMFIVGKKYGLTKLGHNL